MRSALPSWILPALLLAAGPAAGAKSHDDTAPFQLYVYGKGLGGLPLFSTGENALAGDYKSVNDKQAAPVVFTPSTDAWFATPNKTECSHVTWAKHEFAIPADSSASRDVALIESETADYVTNSFVAYGPHIFVAAPGGTMESSWYAVPSGTEGVYSLKWKDESATDGILVTLKKTPPTSTED